LEELSPADRDERIRSLIGTLDALMRVLAKTKTRFEEGMGSEASRKTT